MNILRPLSPRMRQFLYSVVIILTFLGLSYLFLRLIDLDLEILIFFFSSVSKVGFLLGGRVLSFYLLKLGCHGVLACGIGLAVRSLLAAKATPFVTNMMLPGGVSDASSSSRDWRGYINWPSPEEGDYAPGPSTARAPALRGEEALQVASSTATPGQQWETGVDPGQPPMVAEQAGPGPAAPQENAPPAEQVDPLYWRCTPRENLMIQHRLRLETEFVRNARELLDRNGITIEDPEDVRRAASIFYDGWSNPQLRRKLRVLQNPNSDLVLEFIASFRDLTDQDE